MSISKESMAKLAEEYKNCDMVGSIEDHSRRLEQLKSLVNLCDKLINEKAGVKKQLKSARELIVDIRYFVPESVSTHEDIEKWLKENPVR